MMSSGMTSGLTSVRGVMVAASRDRLRADRIGLVGLAHLAKADEVRADLGGVLVSGGEDQLGAG
jgi:hypothetical protein